MEVTEEEARQFSEHLRTWCGHTTTSLARLFGVEWQTMFDWMAGTPVTDRWPIERLDELRDTPQILVPAAIFLRLLDETLDDDQVAAIVREPSRPTTLAGWKAMVAFVKKC